MNMRQASKRDRQREAWTKLPADAAAAIEAYAKEQECTVYEAVRRLLYVGMRTAAKAATWYEEREGVSYMAQELRQKMEAITEREMLRTSVRGKKIEVPW